MTVADLMRQWRAAAGLSTTEAGDRLGLSPRTIEDIEQGRRRAEDHLSMIALNALLTEARAQNQR
jgi:transcriptional regulator with XRE-family HTH domain